MDKYQAEHSVYVECCYCGNKFYATFDDSGIEEITPSGHDCKGVKITQKEHK